LLRVPFLRPLAGSQDKPGVWNEFRC
jgi:hypothetical protein